MYKKLYLFYLIGTPNKPFEAPRLYAVTDNKQLADEFWESRNQAIFFKTKKEVEKYEVRPLLDGWKSMILTKTFLETRKEAYIGRKTHLVPFVCTRQEEETVFIQSDRVFQEVGKTLRFFARIQQPAFIPEIQKLLSDIQLEELYRRYSTEIGYMDIGDALFNGAKDFSINEQMEIRVDQLGLFVHLFHELLPK